MKSRSIGNYIVLFLIGVLVSFYLFPIGFRGLPESLNGKQLEAVLGIMLFGVSCIREKEIKLPKYILVATIIALSFSAWCFLSMSENNSSDNSYATYIRAFAIWLFAAYAVVDVVKIKHGQVDIVLITKYLAWVCVVQCVLAQLVDAIPWFRSFVNTWFIQDMTAATVDRLYGIGASLDSAGVRFCFTEILIAHQIASNKDITKGRLFAWLVPFALILVLGSMIARTTFIGGGMGLLYILYSFGFIRRGEFSKRQSNIFRIVTIVIIVGVAIATYLYNTNYGVQNQLRFAFEAFFNFFEHGEFRTDSSDRLMEDMVIWPTDAKGWWIGYAQFEEWAHFATDMGYCRFVLYCGIIGLSIFSLFFVYNASVVARRFKNAKMLALLLLALTFIIWVKVSTDIFQVYALLFCIAGDFDDEGNEIEPEIDETESEDLDTCSDI